jgi:hypothetical protein
MERLPVFRERRSALMEPASSFKRHESAFRGPLRVVHGADRGALWASLGAPIADQAFAEPIRELSEPTTESGWDPRAFTALSALPEATGELSGATTEPFGEIVGSAGRPSAFVGRASRACGAGRPYRRTCSRHGHGRCLDVEPALR